MPLGPRIVTTSPRSMRRLIPRRTGLHTVMLRHVNELDHGKIFGKTDDLNASNIYPASAKTSFHQTIRFCGLDDPVPLVGEPDVAAGHAPALKRGKHAQALGVGNAEIEGAVDHQRGRLEVGDKLLGDRSR